MVMPALVYRPQVQNKAILNAGRFNWSLKDGWDLERCTWDRAKIDTWGRGSRRAQTDVISNNNYYYCYIIITNY